MKNLTGSAVVVCLLAIAMANVADAEPIVLQNATAFYSQGGIDSNYGVNRAIDGATQGVQAWGNHKPAVYPDYDDNIGAFETLCDQNFNEYTFRLYFNTIAGDFNFRKIRFSYTTADRADFADGLVSGGDVDTDWTVLPVASAVGHGTSVATINPDWSIDWTASGTTGNYTVVTSRKYLELEDVSGFRLEIFRVDTGGRWEVGYNDGSGLLTEITVDGAIVADPIQPPANPVHTWDVDGSGDWNNGANWDGLEAPEANTHTAVFGDAITSMQTVYTNAAVTAKTVQFDNASTYVIAGGGSVNLEADSGNASLDVDQGDHEFQAKVNLNSSTDADVAAGASLTITNVLTLNGNTLTKTGAGTLSINNKVNAGGGSVVGLGGTISGDGAIGGDLTNTSATVAPGNSPGTLTVTGDFSQAIGGTLAIELAGTASGEFDVLAVTGSASLGGSLEISELYTPGGADTWTILTAGGGITGSFDTITAGYSVALANGDTELVLSLAGALLPGDANGDGCVDDLDLTALAVHWQQSTSEWSHGDFDGNGIVNDLDLTALAVNWQQGCGGGGSLAAVNVPEPATVVLLIVGAGLIRRRS